MTEITFACVLLVGAGLLIRSLLRVLDVDMGFRPEQTAAMRVDPDARFDTRETRNAYFDEVLRRVRDVPGVIGAGLTDALPLGRNRSWGIQVKGKVFERGQNPTAFIRVVSDGYIAAMGIRVLAGRESSAEDRDGSEPVVVINETMARRLWPGEDAIGKIIRPDRRAADRRRCRRRPASRARAGRGVRSLPADSAEPGLRLCRSGGSHQHAGGIDCPESSRRDCPG